MLLCESSLQKFSTGLGKDKIHVLFCLWNNCALILWFFSYKNSDCNNAFLQALSFMIWNLLMHASEKHCNLREMGVLGKGFCKKIWIPVWGTMSIIIIITLSKAVTQHFSNVESIHSVFLIPTDNIFN